MKEKAYPTRMHEILTKPGEPPLQTGEVFAVQWADKTIKYALNYHGEPELVAERDSDGNCPTAPGYDVVYMINNGIIRNPSKCKEPTIEDHVYRLRRLRSQKDQWAQGKHAHWLESPTDHAKDRDALDAAIEALTLKPRLTLSGPTPDPDTGLIPCGCGGKAAYVMLNTESVKYAVACEMCFIATPYIDKADAKEVWDLAMSGQSITEEKETDR